MEGAQREEKEKLVCRSGAKEGKIERETAGPASFLLTGSKRLDLRKRKGEETETNRDRGNAATAPPVVR
jgi:hypothetical protein